MLQNVNRNNVEKMVAGILTRNFRCHLLTVLGAIILFKMIDIYSLSETLIYVKKCDKKNPLTHKTNEEVCPKENKNVYKRKLQSSYGTCNLTDIRKLNLIDVTKANFTVSNESCIITWNMTIDMCKILRWSILLIAIRHTLPEGNTIAMINWIKLFSIVLSGLFGIMVTFHRGANHCVGYNIIV